MDSGTACVVVKNRVIVEIIYDETPTNEGSDGLRHVEKVINFISIKHP